MSIPVRHSGRIAFAALIVISLIAALLGIRMFAVAAAPPPGFEIGTTTQPTFTIGPIEGLTTTWHWAPRATSIPLGTVAAFFQPAPPDATVNWTGAAEVARDDQGSTAVCPLVLPGITMVRFKVIPADGGEAISSQSSFNVVDIDVEQITVSPIDVWVDPVEIDADLPQDEINEQTMSYFFSGESIAAVRDLGAGQYRTSVNRVLYMDVQVDPPGFAPLIEWRFDGEPMGAPPIIWALELQWNSLGMGRSASQRFSSVGNHVVEVGPVLNPAEIEVETYRVTITSHIMGQDTIPDGEPVVFIAETDPPGYENDITWLSSTLYGTAEPILGEGPIFIVEFNDTWGIDANGDPFQWLGVKADNTAFGQDQKAPDYDFAAVGLSVTPNGEQTFIVNPILDVTVADDFPPSVVMEYEIFVNGELVVSSGDQGVSLRVQCNAHCDSFCQLTVHGQNFFGECFFCHSCLTCYCRSFEVELRKDHVVAIPPGSVCTLVLDPNDIVREINEANNTITVECGGP